jgi:hypothetical protein
LQLNFTPANEEHEEYKGERYEVEELNRNALSVEEKLLSP